MVLQNSIEKVVAVIGLGYVGLPVAVSFSQKLKVVGFDIGEKRIAELSKGVDRTGEVEPEILNNSNIKYSSSPDALREANFFIIAGCNSPK